MHDFPEIIYQIDEDDCFCVVNDAWDAFALENDAPELAGGTLIGRRLWEHVADEGLRHLYRSMAAKVRTAGGPVRFRFRCDSPELLRLHEMTVERAADGGLLFRARILEETPREPVVLIDRNANRRGDLMCMCSVCKDVQLEGAWVPLEVAAERLRLFEQSHAPSVSHGTCPECYEDLLASFNLVEQ